MVGDLCSSHRVFLECFGVGGYSAGLRCSWPSPARSRPWSAGRAEMPSACRRRNHHAPLMWPAVPAFRSVTP
ncbi:hypothetical protein GFS60_07058 (plasmid) [Rhodococcus sp. WAY2]|nr:hypothetical protein GFS60_07058 [Rhodococcus sp. WAY2]